MYVVNEYCYHDNHTMIKWAATLYRVDKNNVVKIIISDVIKKLYKNTKNCALVIVI